MSELALKLIEENRKTQSTKLDLSNCGMSEIPPQLTELLWLKKLIIAGNEYYDAEERRLLRTTNNGEKNCFSRLPEGVKKLTNLTRLVIGGEWNQKLALTDITPIGQLTGLLYLTIDHASIASIKSLQSLEKLQWLTFSGNQVTDLDPLRALNSLQRLYFDNNQIANLEPLKGLRNLQWLSFSNNKITSLESLRRLRSLERLTFDNNRIAVLEPLKGLRKLQRLSFRYNQVAGLEPLKELRSLQWLSFLDNRVASLEPLKELRSLERLSFEENQVASLEPLKELRSLQWLSFEKNQVASLEPLKELRRLFDLSFSNNQVTSLQPLIALPALHTFLCKGCPIDDCPTDVYETGDIALLKAHYEGQKKSENAVRKEAVQNPALPTEDTRRDVKLIVLGNSNAGKTNLVEYLETQRYSGKRNSTHGLEVHRWVPDEQQFPELKDVSVSIWDFGGQEYYHNVYRLFLSDNSVYLLLWCGESDNNFRKKVCLQEGEAEVDMEYFDIRYWLDTVKHYSGDRDNTLLLAVQNKVDDPDREGGEAAHFKKRIDQVLHEKYGLRDSYHISLKKGSDIENGRQTKTLQHFLYELQDGLKNSADKTPSNRHWQIIRNRVLALKQEGKKNPFAPYLKQDLWTSLDDFKKVCNEILTEPLSDTEADSIPVWLDRGGSVKYFRNIQHLEDKIFLRPDRLAEKIYKVLGKEVLQRGGEFSEGDIMADEASVPFRPVFLELAQQLNLIFPHPDKKKKDARQFIAPQYLPDSHPIEDLFRIAARDAWQNGLWVKVPLFYYKKILHDLLLHYVADEGCECRYYWKHGIMFLTKAATEEAAIRVLIKGLYPKEDEHQGALLISVENKGQQAKNLQREIFRKLLQKLNERGSKQPKEKPAGEGREKAGEQKEEQSTEEQEDEQATKEQKDKQPTFVKLTEDLDVPLFVSYDGESYVAYNDIKNTKEPKVKADPAERKKPQPKQTTDAQEEKAKEQAAPKTDVWLTTQRFEAILDDKPIRAKKVFLSYSHQNTAWLTRLRTHLAGLRRNNLIETWDDKEILPGDQWDAAIKKQLEEADVYIMLLSADFVASEYIWKEELQAAIRNYNQRNAVIIPVLFEPVDLSGLPAISSGADGKELKIGTFEIIPKNGDERLQAVSLWQNQEEALSKVAQRIREAIERKTT